ISSLQPSGPSTTSNRLRPITTAPLHCVALASTASSTSCPLNTQSCNGMPSSPRPAVGPAFGPVTKPSRLIVMSAITLVIVPLLDFSSDDQTKSSVPNHRSPHGTLRLAAPGIRQRHPDIPGRRVRYHRQSDATEYRTARFGT